MSFVGQAVHWQAVHCCAVRWRAAAVRLAGVLTLATLQLVWSGIDPAMAQAGDGPKGSVTGLPLPRYVSLKSDRVNLRQGPNKDHATTWVYQRVGLPVEITAEFETWRRVRDSEGVEGWVLHSLLSGKRTALVAPWEKESFVPVYRQAAETAALAAKLEPNVVVQVKKCDKTWCQVEVARRNGFIRQDKLWGVYPGEVVD